jgi:hypothetical protein
MNGNKYVPDRERPNFFPGQSLKADDLNELEHALREMRWLHNRTLHNWGIALGLAVSGAEGDAKVTVGRGYALDCKGRELILTEPQVLEVPSVIDNGAGEPQSYHLVISFPQANDFVVTASGEGVCRPGGAIRLDTPPKLAWYVSPEFIDHGLDIILAQAWIMNCRLAKPLDFSQRRSARFTEQPYLATGRTWPEVTDWERTISGFKTTIDTSRANFVSTPFYQDEIIVTRLYESDGLPAVVGGWISINDSSPGQFTLSYTLPKGDFGSGRGLLNPLHLFDGPEEPTADWYVTWMGIEGI